MQKSRISSLTAKRSDGNNGKTDQYYIALYSISMWIDFSLTSLFVFKGISSELADNLTEMSLSNTDMSPEDGEDAKEKTRLICQVLELQNTLDGKLRGTIFKVVEVQMVH